MNRTREEEVGKLKASVDIFAHKMKCRLVSKVDEKSGWDNLSQEDAEKLKDAIFDDIYEMKMDSDLDKTLDIANRSMMLYFHLALERGEKIFQRLRMSRVDE